MQFRVRSSSKKSSNNQISLLDFPASKTVVQESAMSRSLTSKIDHFQVVFSSFQEQYRREKEIANTSNLELQKRLDRIEYKVFTAEQDLRQLNEIKQLKPIRESFPQSLGGQSSKNEIMMLKQVIMQQKEAHKQTLKHQNSIIQQLSLKQMRSEQQLRELLNHQKNEYQIRISGQGEQLREIEGYKQRKIQQQYDMIKNMISTSERRIYEDLDRKMKNESLMKDFIEQKVNMVKEQLSSEHKMALIAETKFIKETKSSLESLFSFINNVKKELSEQLSETQKLSLKSIKRLSMAMDISRTKSTDEYKQVLTSNQQITSQLAQLRNYVNSQLDESRQILSKVQEQTSSKLRKSGEFENGSSIKGSDGEKLSTLQKQWNNWKATTEQKNLNVFKEISNTLKSLKLEWRKQNDQLSSQIQAANESLKQMKKSGPSQLKKSVQTIITIFNNQFDVLAEELESLTQMIALSKKESEKSFKDQISRQNSETTEVIKQMINQKTKEGNIYTDKAILRLQENIKRQISKEIKYSTQFISQRIEKLQGDMNALELLLKKANSTTTAQLEDYSLKLKTFNQNYKEYLQVERKEDMQKRVELQQQMRKNASSLMDIYYKKSEFLVDGLKNSVQIAQMKEKVEAAQALQLAKEQLKKQIQSSQQGQQKQLTSAVEKVTKQREGSQASLKQVLQQAISAEKANLSHDISTLKTNMDNKWKENQIKQKQKQAEYEKDLLDLKNMALSMIRDQKRLNEENLIKTKKQIDDKIGVIEKNQQTRQMQQKEREANNRREIQLLITNTTNKLQTSQKQQIGKTKLLIEDKAAFQTKQIADLGKKIEAQNKIEGDRVSKIDQDTRVREAEIQKKIIALTTDQEAKIQIINDKIEIQSKNISELKVKEQQDQIKIQEDKNKSIESLKVELQTKTKSLNDKIQINAKNSEAKVLQMEMKIISLKEQAEKDHIKKQSQKNKQSQAIKGELQLKNKSLSEKIQDLNKRFDDFSKQEAQRQKIKATQQTNKSIQLQKKIADLSVSLQAKNKINTDKIEQLNKKYGQISAASDKQKQKQGQTKKVSEQSVNQIKADFDKKFQQLDQRTRQVESKVASDDHEETIGNIKKSVNKLEAIVFSQQAKNKAMLDRITQDITKLSDNLAMVTNQMRE